MGAEEKDGGESVYEKDVGVFGKEEQGERAACIFNVET